MWNRSSKVELEVSDHESCRDMSPISIPYNESAVKGAHITMAPVPARLKFTS